MAEFGCPAIVRRSHMICKPPKKGTRKTTEFRTDALRPSGISDAEWDAKHAAIDWSKGSNSGYTRTEEHRGGRTIIKYHKPKEQNATHD